MRMIANKIFRGVAQLVARLVWDQDAAGSNPVTSTILNTHKGLESPYGYLFCIDQSVEGFIAFRHFGLFVSSKGFEIGLLFGDAHLRLRYARLFCNRFSLSEYLLTTMHNHPVIPCYSNRGDNNEIRGSPRK